MYVACGKVAPKIGEIIVAADQHVASVSAFGTEVGTSCGRRLDVAFVEPSLTKSHGWRQVTRYPVNTVTCARCKTEAMPTVRHSCAGSSAELRREFC